MGVFDSIKKKLMEEPGRALAADQAASVNKQKEIKANYKKPGYDQTPLEKTRRAAAGVSWNPATSKVPISPVISRENRKGIVDNNLSIGRFDPNRLTLGSGPDGKVGMFKDGQMQEPGSVRLSGGNLGGTPLQAGQSPFFMKSQAAQGLVPQPGTASAIPGMQQNPAVTMPGGDMTGLINQETAMLNSILQGTKSGANFGQNFGQAPAAPGGAPQIGDRAYRDLEKNITDMRNQQKAFISGNYSPSAFGTLSPGQRMNYAAQLGEQIKGMEDTLFNRSSLANDLVKALVAAQSGENIAGTAATAGTEQERIKAGATLGAAGMAAGGRVQSAAMTGAANANDAAQNRAMKADELRFKHLSDMKKQGQLTPEEETEFGFLTKKLQRVGAANEPEEDDLEDKEKWGL